MRTRFVVCISTILLGLMAASGWCATAPEIATIVVKDIDSLQVPATVGLTFTDVDAGPNYLPNPATATQAGGLAIVHNSGGGKKITANAVHRVTNASNTITLNLQVIDGSDAPAQSLVLSGTDQGATLMASDIPPGYNTYNLVWSATATFPDTLKGDYIWDVTFTSSN